MINKTIEYYDNNVDSFYESTVSVDMSSLYEKFEQYMFKGATLMDCGCGSGRDSKYFIDRGYKVTAIDASKQLCKRAEVYIGMKVECIDFSEILYHEEFNGIWACASLLHVEENKLIYIIKKLQNSLKKDGVLYVSFKYGEFSGERNGRYFVDMTEDKFQEIIRKIEGLCILDIWITGDYREDRGDERWFNSILKRIDV